MRDQIHASPNFGKIETLESGSAGAEGFAKFVLELGTFGGSQRAGTPLLLWAGLYLYLVLVLAAVRAFSVRDL